MTVRMRFEPLTGEQSFSWHLKCNAAGGTWRQRLAYRLRVWAARLDGRLTLAFDFSSTPEIDRRRLRECAHHGIKAMQEALQMTVREEAVEVMLRRQRPDLCVQQRSEVTAK